MRVALKSLGCRVNEAELERWARQFQAAGHRIVAESEPADLVVLNSCAVTEEAVRKSRSLLRRLHREQPRAKLALSGCYATLAPDEAASLGVDLVVANEDKERLVALAEREVAEPAMPALAADPEAPLLPTGRQRAFVKVQDGCRHRCTFCIVTVARGEERSRTVPEIIAEIDALTAAGVQEIVLTGIHLGGYGSDLGSSLDRLLAAVLEQTDIPRIRLGSLEPWELPDTFFDLFADSRLMPHLHLPLQSGSDATLKRMARRCRTRDFANLLERARAAIPDLNVTTDIIVGFPGEGPAEWAESLRFIERMAFGHVHIFTYSSRAGTAAARMDGQLPMAVKKQRSTELQELAASSKRCYRRRFIGRTFRVLIEGTGDDHPQGYTPNYLRVAFDALDESDRQADRIVEARITGLDENSGLLRARVSET